MNNVFSPGPRFNWVWIAQWNSNFIKLNVTKLPIKGRVPKKLKKKEEKQKWQSISGCPRKCSLRFRNNEFKFIYISTFISTFSFNTIFFAIKFMPSKKREKFHQTNCTASVCWLDWLDQRTRLILISFKRFVRNHFHYNEFSSYFLFHQQCSLYKELLEDYLVFLLISICLFV